ncbi:MAG TPA: hypothetical protein VMT24_17765 [Aggregatilineaceae bacterium]|nr:hypothetical protein [Aggregatilineaceae bacterium]
MKNARGLPPCVRFFAQHPSSEGEMLNRVRIEDVVILLMACQVTRQWRLNRR